MNNKYKKTQNFHPKNSPDILFNVENPIEFLEFLYLKMPTKSKSKVKSLLTHRLISVDGIITTKYNYMLRVGQSVKVNKFVMQKEVTNDLLDIIYEDDEIIVINKPAGLLTIGTDKEKDLTAYHFVTDYVRQTNSNNRIFIIHRLDRDTSGVVMFAKNDSIKNAFQDNWDELVTFRGYKAIVEGNLEKKSDKLVSWLKETTTHLMYSSDKVEDGKKAITNYKVLKENDEYSLLDVWLETGRKNQIRVQLKDIGHCVIGDKKYGAKTNPLKRLGLHAYKLEVTNPITGENLCFEAKSQHKFATFVTNNNTDKK